MSAKTDKKRELILKSAAEVFKEKGLNNVTMKDIVEKSGISRGGLYLYYDNVTDIFNDVYEIEKTATEKESMFKKAEGGEASASDLLALYLQDKKNELTGGCCGLARALYESYFEEKKTSGKSSNSERIKEDIKIIEKLLERGTREGDLYADDAHAFAFNMVMVLEGMRMAKETGSISDKEVGEEILFLLGGVLSD